MKVVCPKSCNDCKLPPRKPITPSPFTIPSDVACDLTAANFTHKTIAGGAPTNYNVNIPTAAKTRGVVFAFHGGGGDEYTFIDKVVPARMGIKHLLVDLGLGVVLPASARQPHGGWEPIMCDGRAKGANPRPENKDIANILQIIKDLKADGSIDDDTPLVTWGFSNGCNPALDLRTCGPSQIKLAMCGGTISDDWPVVILQRTFLD